MHKLKTILRFLGCFFAATLTAGCDVHEFPWTEYPVEETSLTLRLEFDRELPPYKEVIYTRTGDAGENLSDLYDLRYVINIYQADAQGEFTRTPYRSLTVSKDDVTQMNTDVNLTLPEGLYRFIVWTDYTAQGSLDDRYYTTSDFTQITLTNPYVGNDDTRDAFRGDKSAQICADAEQTVVVEMQRPLGKYRFIATDFDRFLAHAEEVARSEWEMARGENPLLDPDKAPAVDISQYQVIIRYPGFIPHMFNMFTDRPADATTGKYFKSRIVRLDEHEAELGFDYIFINGTEAPYTIAVEIYDPKGQLVGASNPINVPLMRSMLTTIKGDFLTSKAQGGVGVNPDFDGDFTIIIP